MAIQQQPNQPPRQWGPNEYPDHGTRTRAPFRPDAAWIAFHVVCTIFAAAAAIMIFLAEVGEIAIVAYAVIAVAYVLSWFAKKSSYTLPDDSGDAQK